MANNQQGFSFTQFFTTLTPLKATCIIIIIGVIVYFNSLFNGFVVDDFGQLVNNSSVHTLSNIPILFTGSSFAGNNNQLLGVYYKPLMTTAFALMYSVFGARASYYHLFQVILHIANSVVLYFIFVTLFGKISALALAERKEKEWNNLSGSQKIKYQRKYGTPIHFTNTLNTKSLVVSMFLSLVFLVHPINTEAVSYISALQDVLFFFFGSSGFFLLIKRGLQGVWQYVFICGLFLFSMLSKETGSAFVVISLLYVFLFLKKKFLPFLAANGVTISCYLIMRFLVANLHNTSEAPIAHEDFFLRLLNLPEIIVYYLKTFFFPKDLIFDQLWVIKETSFPLFFIPLLLILLFFGFALYFSVTLKKRGSRYSQLYLFFLCWFVIGLGLHSQIIPLDETVADRWFYFPIVGLIGMVGIGVQTILFPANTLRHTRAVTTGSVLCGVSIIILLSSRSIIRNTNFHDNITLYAHDTQIQSNPMLEHALEEAYVQAGPKATFISLQKLVNLHPTPTTFFDLGNVYESERNMRKAEEYYFKAVSEADTYYPDGDAHNPDDEQIYIRLAGFLLLSDKNEAAGEISTKGLRYFPTSGILWEEFAISENTLHRWNDALIAVKKAQVYAPNEQTTSFVYQQVKNEQDIPLIITSQLLRENTPLLLLGSSSQTAL